MKRLPIKFNGAMVRAIIAGKKTQTRRLCKYQPDSEGCHVMYSHGATLKAMIVQGPHELTPDFRSRHGQKGTVLYVKEDFQTDEVWNDFAASLIPSDVSIYWPSTEESNGIVAFGWGKTRSSTYMPDRFAQVELLVQAARVERLQEITLEDAQAEGVESVEEFAELWDSIYGKDKPWKLNPWVWRYEFMINKINK